MALSITVHGFMTLAGTQPAGRWATADITAQDGADNLIYTAPPTVEYMIVAISVTNRLEETVNNVSIAVSQDSDPNPYDFIEWNTSIVPSGTLERTQVTLNANDKLFIRWENESYSVALDGTSNVDTPGNNLTDSETAQFIFTIRDVNVPDELAYIAPDIYWSIPDATTDDFTAVSGTVVGALATSTYDAANTTMVSTYPIDIISGSPILNPGVYTVNFQKTDASGRFIGASTLELLAP
jgi:hypothetical protein